MNNWQIYMWMKLKKGQAHLPLIGAYKLGYAFLQSDNLPQIRIWQLTENVLQLQQTISSDSKSFRKERHGGKLCQIICHLNSSILQWVKRIWT